MSIVTIMITTIITIVTSTIIAIVIVSTSIISVIMRCKSWVGSNDMLHGTCLDERHALGLTGRGFSALGGI